MRNLSQNPQNDCQLTDAERHLIDFFKERPGFEWQLVRLAFDGLLTIPGAERRDSQLDKAINMLDLALTAQESRQEGAAA